MRFIASILIGASIWTMSYCSAPTPALAMSTAAEIALGKEQNAEVDAQSVLVTDPFLKQWVEHIGGNLAKYRARTDITYQFEIIDSNEINSFALPGGFVHVDMGLLNFVSADDELASVLGHEMGHIERRHVITLNQRGNLLSILVGVLSVLSPIGYALGGYGGDLAFAKFSREDELQADQYGLLLMSRAGYDPQSTADMLAKLGATEGDADTDKYFEDHPGAKDRVSHVLGYPELSQTNEPQILAQALHDSDEGRYSYALVKLNRALALTPTDALAADGKSKALTAVTAQFPSDAASDRSITALAGGSGDPAIAAAAAQLSIADSINADDRALLADRAASGGREIETFVNQLNILTGAVPNLGQPKVKGNNLDKAVDGLNRLNRDVNGTIDQTSDVMGTSQGLIDDVRGTLGELASPLRAAPLNPKYRVFLPQYPAATASLAGASDDLADAVNRSRAAVSTAADSVKSLADFLAALNRLDTTSGDISAKDMPAVQAALDKALAAWDSAKSMADDASNRMYAAQSRQLAVRIDLLDLFSSQARFDAYRKALEFRFPGISQPDYATAQAMHVTAGELGMASWLAFETSSTPQRVVAQAQAQGLSVADLAVRQHLFGESMEVAEGLLLQDYLDAPQPLHT
jgi:predicted Zn-dependent protease